MWCYDCLLFSWYEINSFRTDTLCILFTSSECRDQGQLKDAGRDKKLLTEYLKLPPSLVSLTALLSFCTSNQDWGKKAEVSLPLPWQLEVQPKASRNCSGANHDYVISVAKAEMLMSLLIGISLEETHFVYTKCTCNPLIQDWDPSR